MYLIWSNEHSAWWRPFAMGYTPFLAEAGKYHRDEALATCRSANLNWRPNSQPNEIAVREEDAELMGYGGQ